MISFQQDLCSFPLCFVVPLSQCCIERNTLQKEPLSPATLGISNPYRTKFKEGELPCAMRNPNGLQDGILPPSQEHPVPTTCCLILHKEKNTLKKSSRKSGLFPWFIPLLFKALSSWEVAGCNILNSVGVRHDKLSQTRTINHFN